MISFFRSSYKNHNIHVLINRKGVIAVVVAITFIRAIKCTVHYTTDYNLANGVMILALAYYMHYV